MDNERIITRMLQGGDSLSDQRNIGFKFRFPSDTGRTAFINYAKNLGYNTAAATSNEAPGTPYQATITTWNFVKTGIVNPITLELKKEAGKHGGIYDGWDAPPAKKSKER
jgi:hypothetical protein